MRPPRDDGADFPGREDRQNLALDSSNNSLNWDWDAENVPGPRAENGQNGRNTAPSPWEDGPYIKPWSYGAARYLESHGPAPGYPGLPRLMRPPDGYKPRSSQDSGSGRYYGGPGDPDGIPWKNSDDGNKRGSDGKPPRTDPTTALSIALPILTLLVFFFVIYKTWPKAFICVRHMLKRIGLAPPSERSHSSERALPYVYAPRSGQGHPNTFYRAQPHLDKITVESANIELSDTLLGRGEYGLVTKGYATGLLGYPPRTVVAAKSLIRPTDAKQQACLLKEIEIMMFIGRHLNIVNLLGTVMEGNPMLILEYCSNGSLKHFLKKQRPELFYSHVCPDGNLTPFDEDEFQKKQALMDQRTRAISDSSAPGSSNVVLSTRDLIIFSYQIVRGLEYLSSHSIVHRDIAARNVLVTDKNIAKLSDFGMAVQWTNGALVKEKNFDYPMPIKWMAPESILRKEFSQKTDVWAMGILLHEIFTLGGDPYPEFTVQGQVMEFIAKIMDGFRMPRPAYFPIDLHVKMETKCLEINPASRPTFSEILQILEDYIPLTRQEEYLEMSQEYEMFNEMFGTSNNAYVDLNYESMNYKKY